MAAPLIEKHIKAIQLRKKGKSYSQIKKEIQVSKSTLSLWLRNYPLSTRQSRLLLYGREARIEKFRGTMQRKREKRIQETYLREKEELFPMTKRDLYIAGLFLYWGEGLKASSAMVSLGNTDPKIMKFYVYWLINVLNISKESLRVRLHLYKDMNVGKQTNFWSSELKIRKNQFNKPYIKDTTLKSLIYKGFGHGTCDVTVGGVRLKEKIMVGIKAVADSCEARI